MELSEDNNKVIAYIIHSIIDDTFNNRKKIKLCFVRKGFEDKLYTHIKHEYLPYVEEYIEKCWLDTVCTDNALLNFSTVENIFLSPRYSLITEQFIGELKKQHL